MSEDGPYRAKSFLRVRELIENLDIPEGATHIRVVFDNVFSGSGFYKNTKKVRVLSVKAIKDSTVLKEYDMLDIFKYAKGINVWLDVGKQLNKCHLALTKMLSKVEIDLKQKSFIDNNGREVKYYPLTCQQFPKGESLLNKLNKALEEKELQRFNTIAKNSIEAYVEDDDDFNEDAI